MFGDLTRSEAGALVLIVLGIAALVASRFSDHPIRVGYDGNDDDDRVLSRRDAMVAGLLLILSGGMVFLQPWVGWGLAIATFAWTWRVAR